MRTISATEAKQALGKFIDVSQREPVIIERQQRPIAALISMKDYETLRKIRLEEFFEFCNKVSKEAEARGLTEEKLQEILEGDDE